MFDDDNLVLTGYAIANTDWPLMTRIINPNIGELATRDQIQSINVRVAPYDTPQDVTHDNIVPNTAVLVSGTSTVGWTKDDEGWNMRHVLPPTACPVGGIYWIEYTILYLDGAKQKVLWKLDVQGSRFDA
ncbi:MAG TPA: hypothetical protein VF598_01730 [Hymenobacter sp.]|jgi:hypothetical protein